MTPALWAQETATTGAAPGDPAAPKGQVPSPFGVGGPFFILAVFALLYFVIILPMNRRQRKEQEATLAAIKRGTKVLTASGIIGTVHQVKDGDDEIVIRSEDSRFRILRSGVTKVLGQEDA